MKRGGVGAGAGNLWALTLPKDEPLTPAADLFHFQVDFTIYFYFCPGNERKRSSADSSMRSVEHASSLLYAKRQQQIKIYGKQVATSTVVKWMQQHFGQSLKRLTNCQIAKSFIALQAPQCAYLCTFFLFSFNFIQWQNGNKHKNLHFFILRFIQWQIAINITIRKMTQWLNEARPSRHLRSSSVLCILVVI